MPFNASSDDTVKWWAWYRETFKHHALSDVTVERFIDAFTRVHHKLYVGGFLKSINAHVALYHHGAPHRHPQIKLTIETPSLTEEARRVPIMTFVDVLGEQWDGRDDSIAKAISDGFKRLLSHEIDECLYYDRTRVVDPHPEVNGSVVVPDGAYARNAATGQEVRLRENRWKRPFMDFSVEILVPLRSDDILDPMPRSFAAKLRDVEARDVWRRYFVAKECRARLETSARTPEGFADVPGNYGSDLLTVALKLRPVLMSADRYQKIASDMSAIFVDDHAKRLGVTLPP